MSSRRCRWNMHQWTVIPPETYRLISAVSKRPPDFYAGRQVPPYCLRCGLRRGSTRPAQERNWPIRVEPDQVIQRAPAAVLEPLPQAAPESGQLSQEIVAGHLQPGDRFLEPAPGTRVVEAIKITAPVVGKGAQAARAGKPMVQVEAQVVGQSETLILLLAANNKLRIEAR